MSLQDFRAMQNSYEARRRVEGINDRKAMEQTILSAVEMTAKLVNQNATDVATREYEENYQSALRSAMDAGEFDTDDNGNPITSMEQINANLEKFNTDYLDKYEGSIIAKNKLESIIKSSGDVYSNNILKGILQKQVTLKTTGAEDYSERILSSSIENIAAYNEDTLSRGVGYDDLTPQQKEWHDSGTQWGAEALRYDLYLQDTGWTEQERAYTMPEFIKLAKEEQWFKDVEISYSNNVIDGNMTETEFYDKLRIDVNSKDTLDLLGIQEGNEALISSYENKAVNRIAELRVIAQKEHSKRFEENMVPSVEAYVGSGKQLTTSALNQILDSIEVNPFFLTAEDYNLYEGYRSHAEQMDWAIEMDSVLDQISSLDPSMTEGERRRAISSIYSGVNNKDVKRTLNMYESIYFAQPGKTLSLASLEVSKVLNSSPFIEVDMSYLDSLARSEAMKDEVVEQPELDIEMLTGMARVKAGIDEYNDYGSTSILTQLPEYADYKAQNPEATDDEIVFALSSSYNIAYNSMESTARSIVDDQSGSISDYLRNSDRTTLNDPDAFNSYALIYGYINGEEQLSSPMMDLKLETIYMNESQENLNTYLEWCRSKNINGKPMTADSASFTETKEFQDWVDTKIKPYAQFFERNMDTEMKDGRTVRDNYGEIIDSEKWFYDNMRSTSGFIVENAPNDAIEWEMDNYEALASRIGQSFAGFNSNTLGSEVYLAYKSNLITEDHYNDLNTMLSTYTSEPFMNMGINVKELLDEALDDSTINESSKEYQALLATSASRIVRISPTDKNTAYNQAVQIINDTVNSFYSGLTNGEVATNLDKVKNFGKLQDMLLLDTSYLNTETDYPDLYGKTFDYVMTYNTDSMISQYFLKPGKVGDEDKIVSDMSDSDFATALLAETMNMRWETSDLNDENFRNLLYLRFNDRSDYEKTVIIGTVQYGMQVRDKAIQLKEDGFNFNRMSNDGRVFYYDDGSYIRPETDKNGNISNIFAGAENKDETRVVPSDILTDEFLIYFKSRMEEKYGRPIYSEAEIEASVSQILDDFINGNEDLRKIIDLGFEPVIKEGKWNRNFELKWEKR